MWCRAVLGLGLALLDSGAAQAQDIKPVAGRQIAVTDDGMGGYALSVDGVLLLEDGAIFLDPEAVMVGGVAVVTGVAGSGGNACGAAPFVLALPEGGAPVIHGPIESCREFSVALRSGQLVFATEPLPSEPGEVWIWTPETGLTEAAPVAFAADPAQGWEALPGLQGAHPVEAMRLQPVLAALQAGLGPDYPDYAERISDLGSGDLVAGGYLGRACLKFSCDGDWAVLYLDAAGEAVFAIWSVAGEAEPRVWPVDPARWPPAAMAVLGEAVGE